MEREFGARRIARPLVVLLIMFVLLAACGGSDATPTEPAATEVPEPTVTEGPAPPTVEAAVATEVATVTVTPADTPAPSTGSTGETDQGEEVTYQLPTKGSADAPVTLIEFSDYM